MISKSPLPAFLEHLFYWKQKFTGYPFLKNKFLKNHGYPLNLDQPNTFCDWVNYKKIKDRNPLIPITSDKFRVRDYVRQKLGKEIAEELLVPLLFVSDTGLDIPFESFAGEYYLKPNHGSGLGILVNPGMDPDLLKSTCKKWLKTSYGQSLQEWAYRDIPRKILCETVLRDGEGKLPIDFKFYCIHGQVEMIGIFHKSGKQAFACYLDPYLRELGGPRGVDEPFSEIPEIPNLGTLLRLAETLSEDFELVRIDFYSFEDKVYFGEITHYPGSGLDCFDSFEQDLHLGQKISEGKPQLQEAGA